MPRSEATEVRNLSVEFRSQQGRRMSGRLLSYGRRYDVGRFTEDYAPGCFRKSINEAAKRLPLMIEHGHDRIPVGVSVAWQDSEDALYGTWEFDLRSEAVEAARQAERGLLGGLSVGFVPVRTDWDQASADRPPHATRREARMVETSLCALPVLDDALVIAVRSLGWPGEVRTPHLDAARAWLDELRSGRLRPNG